MPKKVLIVDDDENLLLTLEDGLKKYRDRIEPIFASSGKKAMEILRKEKIDLVVSDLRMPEVDGLDLLSFVVQEFPYIPFVLITAYGSLPIKLKAESIGAIRYLEKPISLDQLAKAILEVFDQDMLMKEEFTFLSAAHLAQLIQYEEKTCTMIVTTKDGRRGALHFDEGVLVHAKTEKEEGEEAALEILTWENVNIVVMKRLGKKKFITIEKPLEQLIMEAIKIKDERKQEKIEATEDKTAKKPSREVEKTKEVDTAELAPMDEKSPDVHKHEKEGPKEVDTAELPAMEEEPLGSHEMEEEEIEAHEPLLSRQEVLASLRTVPGYLASAIVGENGKIMFIDVIHEDEKEKMEEFFSRMTGLFSLAFNVYKKATAQELKSFLTEASGGNLLVNRQGKNLIMLLLGQEGDVCLAKYNLERTVDILKKI